MKYLALLVLAFSTCFAKETEITLWHAFDGFLVEKFSEIIDEFNAQSSRSKVTLVQKDNYQVVYKEGMEAQFEGKGPQILQVYEVATLTMMLDEKAYIPVGDLMEKYDHQFDPDVYIDAVRRFYSAPNGKMLSLPWNVSTGILYYNKDAFKKAGLDPDDPPRTWPELERAAIALKKQGYVGFTTAWPAAYHLEHISSWHDLPFASHKNGFGGLKARLNFHKGPAVFHLSKVVEWSKKGLFSYSGRYTAEPESRFTSGECAILMQGANRLPLLQRKADFEIGVGYIPYWPHLIDRPANMNIGGASLWALSGFSDDEYEAIADLFVYLSSTEVQAKWHEATGYLPVTHATYYHCKKKGFYKTHKAAEIAVLEVLENAPSDHSHGVRLGNYLEVRNSIIDQIESALSGEVSAEDALKKAAEEGNDLLESYEKSH